MRRRLIHYGATLILTLCIWGHVSEIFDHWDNTLQTGNDIEYSTVIVVLIAGAVIGFARFVVRLLRTVYEESCLMALAAAYPPSAVGPAALIGHSPPQPLRI